MEDSNPTQPNLTLCGWGGWVAVPYLGGHTSGEGFSFAKYFWQNVSEAQDGADSMSSLISTLFPGADPRRVTDFYAKKEKEENKGVVRVWGRGGGEGEGRRDRVFFCLQMGKKDLESCSMRMREECRVGWCVSAGETKSCYKMCGKSLMPKIADKISINNGLE